MLTVTAAPCGPAAVPLNVWQSSHVTIDFVVSGVLSQPLDGSDQLYVVPFTTKLERMPGRLELTRCMEPFVGTNSFVFCARWVFLPLTAG